MTKQEFRKMAEDGILMLDGATGSNLQKRGMPAGVCPELWITEHPDVLHGLQEEYIEAGSNILYAPTFSGNRIKLEEYGLADKVREINMELVKLCRQNASGRALVAGDITMTGAQLEPLGDLSFETLIDVYKEQLSALAEAGADLIVVETMMSLQETRAALIAAKETCPELPVMATMSFTENGMTLYGTSAESAVTVLSDLGADAVGLNCSAGPDKMLSVLQRMAKVANVPLIAKPNAGMPKLGADGQTTYDMDARAFADSMKAIIESGARIVGGCCGTDPEFIRMLKETAENCTIPPMPRASSDTIRLASERTVYSFTENQVLDLGEGINFASDNDLRQEYADGCYDTACDTALELMDDEKDALYLCAAGCGIDEKDALLGALSEVSGMVQMPVVLAVSDADTAQAVLRSYCGTAAVECLSEDAGEKERLFNVVKWYGAKSVTIDKKIICC